MSEPTKPLRIFLSYAHADVVAVRKLHKYLRDKGFDVWFDKEDLVPGQDWRLEIEDGLYNSDVVIVCLSHTSVSKEGFVQREFNFALDRTLSMPEGRVFLIPVRLHNCKVPRRLTRFHWVDLFEREGYQLLIRGLKHCTEQLERVQSSETSFSSTPDIDTNFVSSFSVGQDISGNVISGDNNIINILPTIAAQNDIDKWEKQIAEDERLSEEMADKQKIEIQEPIILDETAQEHLVKLKAANERIAREKAEQEQAKKLKDANDAIYKAANERIARERAEQEQAKKLKNANDAIYKAANERIARERAEQEQAKKLKNANDAIYKAANERIARERAEQEQAKKLKDANDAIYKAANERISRERAEQERNSRQKVETEKEKKQKTSK